MRAGGCVAGPAEPERQSSAACVAVARRLITGGEGCCHAGAQGWTDRAHGCWGDAPEDPGLKFCSLRGAVKTATAVRSRWQLQCSRHHALMKIAEAQNVWLSLFL